MYFQVRITERSALGSCDNISLLKTLKKDFGASYISCTKNRQKRRKWDAAHSDNLSPDIFDLIWFHIGKYISQYNSCWLLGTPHGSWVPFGHITCGVVSDSQVLWPIELLLLLKAFSLWKLVIIQMLGCWRFIESHLSSCSVPKHNCTCVK